MTPQSKKKGNFPLVESLYTDQKWFREYWEKPKFRMKSRHLLENVEVLIGIAIMYNIQPWKHAL